MILVFLELPLVLQLGNSLITSIHFIFSFFRISMASGLSTIGGRINVLAIPEFGMSLVRVEEQALPNRWGRVYWL